MDRFFPLFFRSLSLSLCLSLSRFARVPPLSSGFACVGRCDGKPRGSFGKRRRRRRGRRPDTNFRPLMGIGNLLMNRVVRWIRKSRRNERRAFLTRRLLSLRGKWGMIFDFSRIFCGFVFNDEKCLLDEFCTIFWVEWLGELYFGTSYFSRWIRTWFWHDYEKKVLFESLILF